MNCQQVDKYLYDYCDNILNPEQRKQIEQHLVNCPGCRRIVEQAQLESSILREQWHTPDLPDDFTARVMNQVMGMVNESSAMSLQPDKKVNWGQRLVKLAAMAAILLMALYIPGLVKDDPNPTQLAGNQETKVTHDSNLAQRSVKSMKTTTETQSPQADVNDVNKETENTENTNMNEPVTVARQIETTHGTVSVNSPNELVQNDAAVIMADTAAAPDSFPVQPANLPTSYTLLNRADKAGSATYTYTDATNENHLIINIAQLPLRQPVAADYSRGQMREEAAPVPAEKSEVETQDVANTAQEQKYFRLMAPEKGKGEAPESNTISYEITLDNQKYLLTISANLTSEELDSILRDLQLVPSAP
jgi:hypothetical protein